MPYTQFPRFSSEIRCQLFNFCQSCLSIHFLAGDLGQTHDSNVTLTHYEQNPYNPKSVLFVGDLSYADDHPLHNNLRWDSWGRFVERSVAYQHWIWVAGNHEIDYCPEIVRFFIKVSGPQSKSRHLCCFWCSQPFNIVTSWILTHRWGGLLVFQGEYTPFKPYLHRYEVPYRDSNSTSPLWYSIKRASAYIIVLSSYSAYCKDLYRLY